MEPNTATRSQRATSLELFFDLTFAFTVTQLTRMLADRADLTADGGVRVTIALLAWPRLWLGTEVAVAALVAGLALLVAVGLAIEARPAPQ